MNFIEKNNKFDLIFYTVIFIALIAVAHPSLFFPPISDMASLFYFFHHLDELPGTVKWLHVMNFDPFEKMRFYPLAFTFYYLFFKIFGSNFFFFNLMNFFAYFMLIIIFYRYCLAISGDRAVSAAFSALFAFCFLHYDVLLWSCHIYVLIGFTAFLTGFICYFRYIVYEKKRYLYYTFILFMTGILCYEAFFLWPLAIFILIFIDDSGNKKSLRIKHLKVSGIFVSIIYLLTFLIFIFTRHLGTYSEPAREFRSFFSFFSIFSSICLVFFNLLYNTLIVNLLPFLGFHFRIRENIYMDGPGITFVNSSPEVVYWVGGLAIIGLLFLGYRVYKKEKLRTAGSQFFFLLFLLVSEKFIVYFGRINTNDLAYGLTEFRYQLIPDAFTLLILILLFSWGSRFIKIKKKYILIPAFLLLLIHIHYDMKLINIYKHNLNSLQTMMSGIKRYIKEGKINNENKIYLDKNINDYFPHLCWNIEMGARFIDIGTYEWMFSEKEIKYFTFSPEEVKWIINKENFSVVPNTPGNAAIEGTVIKEGKTDAYTNLGFYFESIENYSKMEETFDKALKMVPESSEYHHGIAKVYLQQGLTDKAFEHLKIAVELDPYYPPASIDLGHLYNETGQFDKSEALFERFISLNRRDVYEGLFDIYMNHMKLDEAEGILGKYSDNKNSYLDLARLYQDQERYDKAEEILKKVRLLFPDMKTNRK